MGWRETGEVVRERGLQCLSEYAQRHLHHPAWQLISVPVDSLNGIFGTGQHRLARTVPYIWRSRQEQRDSDFFNSRCQPSNPNGRPKNEQARAAATVALFFYDAWRNENEQLGIKDYGHRGEMKDIAARAVVEDLFAWRLIEEVRPVFVWELGWPKNVEDFILVVRDLMEKPKPRRSPSRNVQLELLASSDGLGLPPKPPSNS